MKLFGTINDKKLEIRDLDLTRDYDDFPEDHDVVFSVDPTAEHARDKLAGFLKGVGPVESILTSSTVDFPEDYGVHADVSGLIRDALLDAQIPEEEPPDSSAIEDAKRALRLILALDDEAKEFVNLSPEDKVRRAISGVCTVKAYDDKTDLVVSTVLDPKAREQIEAALAGLVGPCPECSTPFEGNHMGYCSKGGVRGEE